MKRFARFKKVLCSGVLVGAVALGSLVSTANPASAACVKKYVSSDGQNPVVFRIPSNSTCADLNIGSATVSQTYAGFYYNGSAWVQGSAGWIARNPGSSYYPVIKGIRNGSLVKVVGCCVDAYIWTMS